MTGPQNPTETDPQASQVTQTQKPAKNENGVLESVCRGGSEKSSFAMCLVKKKWTIFNAQKHFRRLRRESAQQLINGPVN